MTNEMKLCGEKRPLWCREPFFLAILIIITFLIYIPILNNYFTNWDDPWYVTENIRISDFSFSGLAYWFTHYFHGQYSPIGNLVTVALFQVDGLNPFWYHLTSVVLHIVNVLLVFVFVKKLSGQEILGLFVALFFALHPLQTESVAWVAAIKIPLYALFTLIALIWYLRFLDTGKWKWYLLAFIPFLLAFGSKEQSMALVGSLIFIDYYRGRNVFSLKVLLEKLPWLALGVLMGLNSIAATNSYGIVTPAQSFGFNEQLVLPAYAFITYLWKMVIPAGMTAIYPYPTDTASLSWFYYVCFVLVLGIIVLFVRNWKRNRALVFGIGFFVANIILVLQIVPTRNIIIADRYVYLPLIGFFFIVGNSFLKGLQKGSGVKALLFILIMVWIGGLSIHSIKRNKVWKSSETMWGDVVEKEPDALIGWYNLAGWYADENRHKEAIGAFLEVLRINPYYYNGLYNIANSYYITGAYELATSCYQRALYVDPGSKDAALNLFMALLAQDRKVEAGKIIDKLEKQYPGDKIVAQKRAFLGAGDHNEESFNSVQLFMMAEKAFKENHFFEAISFYTKSMEMGYAAETVLFNRGNAYFIIGKYIEAIEDYTASIKLQSDFADCWYNRGMAYRKLGEYAKFCADMKHSAELGNTRAAEKLHEQCK